MAVSLFLVKETDLARLYRRQGQRNDEPDIWVPKSVCSHTTKYPPMGEGKLPLHRVEIDWWFIKKHNLTDT